MNLTDKLSQEELITIEKWITQCAFDGDPNKEYRNPVTDILQPWSSAKSRYLYQVMGQELILTKEIEYSKGAEELEEQIDDTLFAYDYDKGESVFEFVTAYNELTGYNGPLPCNWNVERLMTPYNLASNRWQHSAFTIEIPDQNPIRVVQGAKITKILGKLAKAFNLPGFEEFRIAHSQVLNQKKLVGELRLSIHPLDFMTMSDNDCGWTSCMNWGDWGEYRQGTVEMMNSDCVVCAYLTSKTPMMMPGGVEWSNKKWRQLFIVSKDVITGVKGYPYQNPELVKIVLEWLRELTATNLSWNYNDQIYQYAQGESFKFNGDNYYLSFHTHNMYNDFGCEHYALINPDVHDNIIMNYSGYSECMCCGCIDIDLDGESSLVCLECEEVFRCAECGGRYDLDEMHEVDGQYYCEYCYDHYISECAICGSVHRNYNTYTVHLASEDFIYTAASFSIDLCDDCVNDMQENAKGHWQKYFKRLYEQQRGYGRYLYVDANECTKEGLDLFGFDSVEHFKECARGPYVLRT